MQQSDKSQESVCLEENSTEFNYKSLSVIST